MKKYALTLFVAAFAATALFAPGTTWCQKITVAATPEAAGFSTERLKRMDNSLDEWVSKRYMNGAAVLIISNGNIVYDKGFGYNDLDTKAPLEKDAIFRIASQTKAITSLAVMMLWEEGKFLLDDPVSKYIPSFAHETVLDKFNPADTTYTTVPAKRDITIRDLLTHTSGLGYAQIGIKEANAIYAKNNITAGLDVHGDKLYDAMNRLGPLPLMRQPGTEFMYGLNIDLLGDLVEIWSGMSLEDFFEKRIFEPLGMKDTYFNVPQEKAGRLVNFYIQDSTGTYTKNPKAFTVLEMNYPLKHKSYFSGGGGLSSTTYDYGIFLQMMLNGGIYNGKRLLSSNTVRMMTMNQIGDIPFGDNKFGLGFMVVTEKGSAVLPWNAGSYTWGGAFSTTYWVDPKLKLVVLFYRQMWGQNPDLDNKFKSLVYQAFNN